MTDAEIAAVRTALAYITEKQGKRGEGEITLAYARYRRFAIGKEDLPALNADQLYEFTEKYADNLYKHWLGKELPRI